MEIRLAKTAGFCFGVNRAVELTNGLLAEGYKVATLGPLIHNPQAVEDMQRKGAQVVDTVQDVPAGYEVVIRSHGVPRSVYDELTARGIRYHDATCPFVQKIQRIAAEAGVDVVPCRILYDTPDGRMHLFCKVRVLYGEPMPAAQFAMEGRRDTKKLRANKQALLEAWEKMGA